jgi:hypothetical protein
MISICRFRKSGQFKVRTQASKKPYPVAVPEGSAKAERWALVRVQILQNRKLWKPTIADSKSGQFKVRTPLSKNLNSGRFLGVCQEI